MSIIEALLVISLVNVALGYYLANDNTKDKAGPKDIQIDDANVKYNVNKDNYLPNTNTKRYTAGQNEIEIEDLKKGNYLPNTKTKRDIAGQNKIELDDDLEVKYDNKDFYNPGNEYVPAEVGFESDENEDQDKDANESNNSDEKNNDGDTDDDENFKIEDIDGYEPNDKSGDEIKGLQRIKKSIRHLNNCRGVRRHRYGCKW